MKKFIVRFELVFLFLGIAAIVSGFLFFCPLLSFFGLFSSLFPILVK